MRKSARAFNKIKRDKNLKLQKRIKDSQQYSFKDAYKLQNYVRNIGKCLKGVDMKECDCFIGDKKEPLQKPECRD